ncbi:hypothetical protein ElyMa_000205300 [Elysia marginata]|uniref:Uncharacterized protein n=1 Tax=Elysia marginata TaxID=1093978 RepID=A0AAV4EYA7_9GAST|nr:hypothetical protein ElyMa_000205300 [Elysia marginata]
MSGKIVRIITTTIFISITNGHLSINISSHTNKQEKDKNWHWQYKIVKIVESGVAKVDHIWKHFRQESSVPHAEDSHKNSHCHFVSKAAVFGDQCIIKRCIKVKKDTSVTPVKSEA